MLYSECEHASPYHVEDGQLLSMSYIFNGYPNVSYDGPRALKLKSEAFVAKHLLHPQFLNIHHGGVKQIFRKDKIFFSPLMLMNSYSK